MSSRSRRQRGFTLVFCAIGMVVFILFAGLAIDLGVYFTARTSAQHAADAGALAGAFSLVNDPTSPQPAAAQDAAVIVANQHKILATQVSINPTAVSVDLANRRVTVTVPRTAASNNPIPVYFVRIIGITGLDLRATATAEANQNATRFSPPIWVPNTALSKKPMTAGACDPIENLVDQNPPYSPTQWALNQIGTQFTLIQQPLPPSRTTPPNSFYIVEFGDLGSYTNNNSPYTKAAYDLYTCLWKNGFNSPACSPPVVPSAAVVPFAACGTGFPGGGYPVDLGDDTWTQPTVDGVNGLICAPSGNCSINPPDTWQGVGRYIPGTGGASRDTSRSLVLAPIWQNCVSGINGWSNSGGNKFEIVGFALVFIDKVETTTITVNTLPVVVTKLTLHLVNILGCPNPVPAGEGFAVPVRLVQTP